MVEETYFVRLILELQSLPFFPIGLRRKMLRLAGIDVAHNAVICSGVKFRTNNVHIGKNSLIGRNCHLYACKGGKIHVGDNVKVSFDTSVVSSTHKIGSPNQRVGKSVYKDVYIGDGCWIGMRTVILPGVKIGKGCVIGGGTVVVKDCEDNGLYVGVPACRKKELSK